MKKYLEFKDEKSSKFWEITVSGNSHTVRYGKIGTEGQSKTKEFASEEEAIKDAEKLAASKIKKGYVEMGDKTTPDKKEISKHNEKILSFLNNKIKQLEKNLEKETLTDIDRELLDALESVREDKNSIVKNLVKDLIQCFTFWVSPSHNPQWGTPVDFIYFEWSGCVSDPYDTDAGAYGFYNSKPVKDPGEEFPDWGPGTFDYCGSLDLNPVLESVAIAYDEDEEICDDIITLYRYQVAKFVNYAFIAAQQSKEFNALVLDKPVNVYLAEHDEIPVPAYVID